MKKIVILLVAVLMGVSFNASAQLEIKGKTSVAKRLTTLYMMNSWLYEDEGHIFYVAVTSNEFDPSVWLDLGEGKEQAAETMRQLLAAFEEAAIDDALEIKSMDEVYRFTKVRDMGLPIWRVTGVKTNEVRAGAMYMETMQMKKALKYLEK